MQADITLHDRNLDLIDSDLQVALRIGALGDSSLLVRKVGQVRRLVVASPDYLVRRPAPRLPADLAEHDIVLTTVVATTPEWRFEVEGKARAVGWTRACGSTMSRRPLRPCAAARAWGEPLLPGGRRPGGRATGAPAARFRASAPAGSVADGRRPVHAALGAGLPRLRRAPAGALAVLRAS